MYNHTFMVIIAHYQTQIEADEDAAMLIRKGIAATVYGKAAPVVLYAGLDSGPVCIAVSDEAEYEAVRLLSRRQGIRRTFMTEIAGQDTEK